MSDIVLNTTPFETIYDNFFSRVTDDMYALGVLTKEDTEAQLQDILVCAIPVFEFPRFDIFDYELGYSEEVMNNEGSLVQSWTGGFFNTVLTQEEVNILGLAMVVEWIGRNLTHIDLVREKYSGPDFKMNSQANHMSKLQLLKSQYQTECFHMQRLYKRRKRTEKGIRTTLGQIMEVYDGVDEV